MGIISHQGSSQTKLSRTLPKRLRPEIEDKRPVIDQRAVLDETVVKKSFLNNSSINQDSFKNDLSVVAGYPEGSPIIVTYYSQNIAVADIMSHNVDIVTNEKHNVHISWTQIRNFELRLESDLNFNFDADNNVVEYAGEALVFAGFEPKINDLFLYQLRGDSIGVFTVTSIQRLAIGQDTYHRIGFTLTEYLTPEFKQTLTNQTTVTMVFDKTKFLAGNHAFLTTTDYIDQQDLYMLRKELIQNYHDRFYVTDVRTFVRPDGIYDPYVVEFWNRRISYTESGFRPDQLLVNVMNYHRTIWSALSGNPIKNVSNYTSGTTFKKKLATFWSLAMTPLLGYHYLCVGDERGGDIDIFWNRSPDQTRLSNSKLPIIRDERSERYLKAFAAAKQDTWDQFVAKEKPHPECPLGYATCQEVHDFHKCTICSHLNECLRWKCVYDSNPNDPCQRPDHHPPSFTPPNPHEHPEPYYVMSQSFYDGASNMPPFERMVYDILTGKPYKPHQILETVSSYMDWDDESSFYQHLLSFFLIGRALYWLQYHS